MSSQPNQPTPPPNQTATTLSQTEMQELISLRREKAALSALMWELVRQAAPETHDVEVSAAASDPLWQLAFVQSSDPSGTKVRILAGTIMPITEQEKKRVVRLLRGTDKPMHEALTELKLERFPASYVEKQIETHLVWKKGAAITGDTVTHTTGVIDRWESVTPPSAIEQAKNLVHWPK